MAAKDVAYISIYIFPDPHPAQINVRIILQSLAPKANCAREGGVRGKGASPKILATESAGRTGGEERIDETFTGKEEEDVAGQTEKDPLFICSTGMTFPIPILGNDTIFYSRQTR